MEPKPERRCHFLIGVSLVLLTIGIGYLSIVGSTLADFVVITAGLLLGWIAFIYCFASASFWK